MKQKRKRINWIAALISLTLITYLMVAPAMALSYNGSDSYRSGAYYRNLCAVQLTGNQRADIVAVAKSQLGYHEGNNSSSLSGESNGGNNYTEYGKWYGLQAEWCAMFTSWCAARAGIGTDIVPKHSFTPDGLKKFQNWGRAYSRESVVNGAYTPQSGDIIYFKGSRNNNITNHTGLVTGYSGGTVYTIEGNSDNAVRSKAYSIQDTYIVYICSPAYGGQPQPQPSGDCFPACAGWHTSIVDALRSIGVDSSYSYRKTIAAANGISGYSGSAQQNSDMLNRLKAGSLRRPGSSPSPAPAPTKNYFPTCASWHTSIADALRSVGADGSYSYRKSVASANGILGYSGSASQNTQMLNLLKAGKLIKP